VDIVHQDAAIVVVNKPGGLLSVPGRGADKQDCVVARIRDLFPDCIPQPSVHRLDMDTSGLMVLALTTAAHKHLSLQFQNRTIKKRYVALVTGIVEKEKGEINLAFRLDVTHRPYQIFDPVHGKWGTTLWEKIEVKNRRTRILFTPLTGRTHQLRLHAAHPSGLGCPIVGDRLYGHGKPGDRLHLHAACLRFRHPDGDTPLCYESPAWF
jgi:tRNA pseudouridine32 synthase/23S rRNA pseudouridine746 synthase